MATYTDKANGNNQFAILGLGRFGMSLLRTLAALDAEVLACDGDSARVHEAADLATHVVQADVTDEVAMRQLGLGNFDVVVVAIGEDFESSLLATVIAKEQGAGFVLVKAAGPRQKKILLSIGADQVVLPEYEMGAKVARRLAKPNVLDILEDSDRYTISEMLPEAAWVGRSVRNANIRETCGTMILAISRGSEMIIPVSPNEVLRADDVLITLEEHNAKNSPSP